LFWRYANRWAICAVTLAVGYICTNWLVISSLFLANSGQISQTCRQFAANAKAAQNLAIVAIIIAS